MLRPLPLVAVRQQQHQAAHALPLRLGAGDELIDDHLRLVDEIAELRLPDPQPARTRARHAVLEAEHRRLAERAVDDLDLRLAFADVHYVIERNVLLAVLVVVEDRVAMAEGSAPGVLAGEPNRNLFEQQARVGDRLRAAPIDYLAALHHLEALIEQLLDARVRREVIRQPVHRLGRRDEPIRGHARVGAPIRAGPLEALPHAAEGQHLLARHEVARVAERVLERALELFADFLDAVRIDHALLLEALGVTRYRRRMLADLPVHHRLRERRIVELVVAVAAG